ncbi:MAG: hypothetical protein ACKV2Q_17165 [Planctomycetaceae bacterium]
MIYDQPSPDAPLDQGDLVDECMILRSIGGVTTAGGLPTISFETRRVVLLTQTCDLANGRAMSANVAEVFDVQYLIDQKLLKTADVRGPLRAGRIWGWYFLPADSGLGLGEMVVDLRRLHTVSLEMLRSLCRAGRRRGRIQPLYREHLAKHFADTFSRIGLPRPYETL